MCLVHLCSLPTAWHNRHLLNEGLNELIKWRQGENNKSKRHVYLGGKTEVGKKEVFTLAVAERFRERNLVKQKFIKT